MVFAHWFVVSISDSKEPETIIFPNWCGFVKGDKTGSRHHGIMRPNKKAEVDSGWGGDRRDVRIEN